MANRLARFTKRFIVRVYAAVILLVVVWAGYTAVAYLVRSVFRPTLTPAWFRQAPPTLEASEVRSPHMPGVTGPTARAPLGHYHTVDAWFQPDPHNGCSTSGCHNPLPHKKSKDLRAFANLHATFMDCHTCHAKIDPAKYPVPVMWVDKPSDQPCEPPAILRLVRYFDMHPDAPRETPAAAHAVIVPLLEATVAVIGKQQALDYLLTQMKTSEPGSPVWQQAVAHLQMALPYHMRGEYGAKIAPKAPADAWQRQEDDLMKLADDYFAAAPQSQRRNELYDAIHKNINSRPKGCLACHGGEPPRIDFHTLGFSDERVKALRGQPIARLMQQIVNGQPFHLPQMLEGPHAP